MDRRIYFVKFVTFIMLSRCFMPLCYSSPYNIDAKLKQMDIEYGEVLSSVENGELKQYGFINRKKWSLKLRLNSSDIAPKSTRCTTDQPITLDPAYMPDSDEDDEEQPSKYKDSEPTGHNEIEGNTKKGYLAPDAEVKPEHYIDDA